MDSSALASAESWLSVIAIAKLVAAFLVAAGVAIEFGGDWVARPYERIVKGAGEARLAGLSAEAADATKAAAIANENPASANERAAVLMKENLELERALAPRNIEIVGLAGAVRTLPRVPLFISSLDREEPKEIASDFVNAFLAIGFADTPVWSVTLLPPAQWYPDGISIKYAKPEWPAVTDDSVEKVAVAICEHLKSQSILASAGYLIKGRTSFKSDWPPAAPDNAVVIWIGRKPSHFWQNKRLEEKGFRTTPEMGFCTTEEFFEHAREQSQQHAKPPPPATEK
jgi:hypothetical protein